MMQQGTIVIHGATGNCGSATLNSLIKRNAQQTFKLRTLTRDMRKADQVLKHVKDKVEVVEYDVSNVETVHRALQGADRIFIAPPNEENRAMYTNRLIDAAKSAGIRHVVLISVPGADTKQILFQRQFAEMEEHLISSGLQYTILRCAFFMENFLSTASTIKAEGKFYNAFRDGKFPPIAVKDIGEVAGEVLVNFERHVNKTYTLLGPETLNAYQIAERLGKVAGKPVQYVDIPPESLRQAYQKMGIPEWQAKGMLELIEVMASNVLATTNDHVISTLGRPGTTFDQFLQDYANVFH